MRASQRRRELERERGMTVEGRRARETPAETEEGAAERVAMIESNGLGLRVTCAGQFFLWTIRGSPQK